MGRLRRSLFGACVAGTVLVPTVGAVGLLTIGPPGSAAAASVAVARPLLRVASTHAFTAPPTTADCEAQLGIACYDPAQIEAAYDVAPLWKAGTEGQGSTIAIVDSFGSPTIKSQLQVFDKQFGLPAPPSFKIITPAGSVPPYDPSNSVMEGWAFETSLDVEYAHAIAPKANILLAETPVAETEGTAGFPQIVTAEEYIIGHHLAGVISQSFAATEETFPNAQSLLDLRGAYKEAAKDGVTMLAGSGDGGATGDANDAGTRYYLRPVTSWPASDPLVTAVGGTQLHLTATGARTQSDTVWNDTNLLGSPAASGGGVSEIFSQPSYQAGAVSSPDRTTPDISMSAAVDGGVLVYLSAAAAGTGEPAGYYIVGGTSEAGPLFAGIVALADQVAGHSLGLINPALYRMAGEPDSGIVDVTAGTNTVTFPQGGAVHTVKGHDAVVGYDDASGVGTVDAAVFVPALAAAASGTTPPPPPTGSSGGSGTGGAGVSPLRATGRPVAG